MREWLKKQIHWAPLGNTTSTNPVSSKIGSTRKVPPSTYPKLLLLASSIVFLSFTIGSNTDFPFLQAQVPAVKKNPLKSLCSRTNFLQIYTVSSSKSQGWCLPLPPFSMKGSRDPTCTHLRNRYFFESPWVLQPPMSNPKLRQFWEALWMMFSIAYLKPCTSLCWSPTQPMNMTYLGAQFEQSIPWQLSTGRAMIKASGFLDLVQLQKVPQYWLAYCLQVMYLLRAGEQGQGLRRRMMGSAPSHFQPSKPMSSTLSMRLVNHFLAAGLKKSIKAPFPCHHFTILPLFRKKFFSFPSLYSGHYSFISGVAHQL